VRLIPGTIDFPFPRDHFVQPFAARPPSVFCAGLAAGRYCRRLPASMVTASPTGKVNRFRDFAEKPCKHWFLHRSARREAAPVHSRFIAMIKLLFKFYRS
jgi:hypothetical protein